MVPGRDRGRGRSRRFLLPVTLWTIAAITLLSLAAPGCGSDTPTGPPPVVTPATLVLQNSIVNGAVTYSAMTSITAGPNFTISGSAVVTMVTHDGNIYLRPGVNIRAGGSLQVVRDPNLMER